jgi:phosphoadenosine phosphosulfate reductase
MPRTFMEKVHVAIERLRAFQPPEGYYLAFSGGKDSCVLKELAVMAGVKFDAHYSVTTIDPPDVVQFIRRYHPDVIWDRPEIPLLKRLETKGFPLRQARWCCDLYKETGGSGRVVLTGIRNAESAKRSTRRLTETCYKDPAGKRFVNPIIDFLEKDIWMFIGKYELPYVGLYDEGCKRVGCLMCPMASPKHRLWESERYPLFTATFIRSFEKLYAHRKAIGAKSVNRWKSGKEMFDWWLTGKGGKPKEIK